jgi:hypothetical protein
MSALTINDDKSKLDVTKTHQFLATQSTWAKAIRRFTLATSNAHGLRQKYGFKPIHKPDTFMEVYIADIYATVS